MLYLIEILHQTTTVSVLVVKLFCCILLKFYIKPQLDDLEKKALQRCILLKFYIKPQLDDLEKKALQRCILLKFYIKPQR